MALREKLEVIVDANVQGFVRGMDKAGAAADKNLGKTDDKLQRLAGTLTTTGAAMVGAGAVAAVGLGKLAVSASNYGEALNKATVIAGKDGAKALDKFAQSASKSAGISKTAALDASAGFAALGKMAGINGPELAQFSTRLTQMAGDLASFNNTSVDEALLALKSGLQGESEPLKRFNIFLTDAALKQEYLAVTGQKVTGVLSQQQKVVAANSLIFKQGADAVGDFARTSDSLPNRQRQLAADFENLKASIGAGVVPVVGVLADGMSKLSQSFADLPSGVQKTTGTVAAIGTVGVTAAGGLAFLTGQAIKMKDTFTTAEGTLTRTGSAMKGLGIAAGVAAGLIVLDQALTAITTSGTAAETTINNLAASNDTSQSLDLLIQRTKELDGGWNDVKQTFSQTGELGQYVKLNGINTDITNLDKVLGDLAQSKNWPALRNAIEALKDAQVSQGDSDWLTGGSGGPEGVSNFAGIVDKYSGSLKAADSAAQAAASGTGGFADAATDSTGAVTESASAAEEAASAWKDYADAVKAATDPLFAVTDSSEKVADAQKGVAEAFKALSDGGATAEEVKALADAQREAAKAGLDHLAAVTSLRGGIESGEVSLEQSIGVLDTLAAQYPELGGAIQTVKVDFLNAAAAANAMPKSVTTDVTANTGKFDSIIARVVGTKIPPKSAPIDGEPSKFDSIIRRIAGTRPPTVRVPVDADTSSFQSKLNGLLAGFRSQVASVPFAGAIGGRLANGGITSYAGGGTRLPSQAMIQPGRGAGLVQWAEGETGGEAFIPLAPSKRGRSKKLWVETGKRLGVLPMADGGIRSFGFGGFTADDYTGQLVEQMNNFWQAQFDSASLGRQAELAAQRRDVLQPWSDEWVKWNNIAVDSLQKLAREQADIAERAAADQLAAMERNAAAAKDIADNQFSWMYSHASDLEKLQIAISKRDSFGQFTDDWIEWAKEVEQLQMAGVGTARSTASGGRSQGSAPFYLTVNVNAEGLVTDPSEVGRQVVGAIRSYEQQNGTAWRS